MKIIKMGSKPKPPWLGRWVCSYCHTEVELNNDDVRMKVDHKEPCLWGIHCPGCNLVDMKWERP